MLAKSQLSEDRPKTTNPQKMTQIQTHVKEEEKTTIEGPTLALTKGLRQQDSCCLLQLNRNIMNRCNCRVIIWQQELRGVIKSVGLTEISLEFGLKRSTGI